MYLIFLKHDDRMCPKERVPGGKRVCKHEDNQSRGRNLGVRAAVRALT